MRASVYRAYLVRESLGYGESAVWPTKAYNVTEPARPRMASEPPKLAPVGSTPTEPTKTRKRRK